MQHTQTTKQNKTKTDKETETSRYIPEGNKRGRKRVSPQSFPSNAPPHGPIDQAELAPKSSQALSVFSVLFVVPKTQPAPTRRVWKLHRPPPWPGRSGAAFTRTENAPFRTTPHGLPGGWGAGGLTKSRPSLSAGGGEGRGRPALPSPFLNPTPRDHPPQEQAGRTGRDRGTRFWPRLLNTISHYPLTTRFFSPRLTTHAGFRTRPAP